jgi:hypothetical protein
LSWTLPFSEPIALSDGSELATLRDAFDCLKKLPASEQGTKEWKNATHFLTQAAEHYGAVAFARIATWRLINQQVDRVPEQDLVHLIMQEVDQLKGGPAAPITGDQKTSSVLPGVMQVIAAIVSAPAAPIEIKSSTSTGPAQALIISADNTDEKNPISPQTLQSAITEAVKKAEPAFVSVIIQQVTPKSRFDANWALRGVRFGRADREKANKAVASVVERMQREFRLSDD